MGDLLARARAFLNKYAIGRWVIRLWEKRPWQEWVLALVAGAMLWYGLAFALAGGAGSFAGRAVATIGGLAVFIGGVALAARIEGKLTKAANQTWADWGVDAAKASAVVAWDSFRILLVGYVMWTVGWVALFLVLLVGMLLLWASASGTPGTGGTGGGASNGGAGGLGGLLKSGPSSAGFSPDGTIEHDRDGNSVIRQDGKTYRQDESGKWEADRDLLGYEIVERDAEGQPVVDREMMGRQKIATDEHARPIIQPEES